MSWLGSIDPPRIQPRRRKTGYRQDADWWFETLQVGDTVTVDGEALKVTAIDPETFDVTREDHLRYGVKEVKDGEVIYGAFTPVRSEMSAELFAKPSASAPDSHIPSTDALTGAETFIVGQSVGAAAASGISGDNARRLRGITSAVRGLVDGRSDVFAAWGASPSRAQWYSRKPGVPVLNPSQYRALLALPTVGVAESRGRYAG
ncbi:MAG: hypothetical protein ABIO94_03145 [Opitutaceae bacterium]